MGQEISTDRSVPVQSLPDSGHRLQNILQRMVLPQLIELDIFLEALQRGVARELLEPGDVDALGDAARDGAAPQAVPGEGVPCGACQDTGEVLADPLSKRAR